MLRRECDARSGGIRKNWRATFESVDERLSDRWHSRSVRCGPRRIDFLTEITGVSYAEAEAERQFIIVEGITIPVIGISHLIKNKRAVGRPQDQADAARLEALR